MFFVPLGDVVERRKLIGRLFAAVSLALVAAGLAPSFWALVAASVVIGVMASVTHILVPIAPELAEAGEDGRAIGTVMSGLLLGVLLGRVASGAVAEALGWRAVFLLAAVSTGAFVPLLWWRMPALPPPRPVRYGAALRSLWDLVCQEPVLREASTVSFLVFASFIAFWTNLAFFLGSPHYHLGAGVAGSFGLLGAGGAVVASLAGRLADRYGTPAAPSRSRWRLMSARICDALGIRLPHRRADRRRDRPGYRPTVHADLQPDSYFHPFFRAARSRINTVYMIVFFLGGALGSALSALAWSRWQWSGVCGWGLVMLALAWLRHGTGQRCQPA